MQKLWCSLRVRFKWQISQMSHILSEVHRLNCDLSGVSRRASFYRQTWQPKKRPAKTNLKYMEILFILQWILPSLCSPAEEKCIYNLKILCFFIFFIFLQRENEDLWNKIKSPTSSAVTLAKVPLKNTDHLVENMNNNSYLLQKRKKKKV